MDVLQRLHNKDNTVTLDDIRACVIARGKYIAKCIYGKKTKKPVDICV